MHDSLGTHNEPQYAETGVPADAADLTEVAAFAAKVGNMRVGTTTERNNATGADVWQGLLWYDTDLNQYFSYDAGWTMILSPDLTANIATFSTGWTGLTAGHTPRVRRHGSHVNLYGAISFGTNANYNSMFTVPAGFAPATTTVQFIGAALVSIGSGNGEAAALVLTNGVVSFAGTGYSTASLPGLGSIVTLGGLSWWMD